jgi:nitrate/nitrite-specific signal transduction histidine kinase
VHAGGRVAFEVEDDGSGRKVAASSDGIGKSIMEYRARAIGARLEVARSSTGGLRVSCELRCGCNRAEAQ